jgi:hypothetical protein
MIKNVDKNVNVNAKTNWGKLEDAFQSIIESKEEYRILFKSILISQTNNNLLYSPIGFPIDLMVEIILKKRFGIKTKFYRTKHLWDKTLIYNENQYFIELDMMNPENHKNMEKVTSFLLHIITTKNIDMNKHLIIIKNIDLLSKQFYEFRILLEKYSNNIVFICTTHYISKIETPIRSRFNTFRIPLFTHEDVKDIFVNYLEVPLNDKLLAVKTRDIVKAVFISEIEGHPEGPEILTPEFINYNYPPFTDFIKTYNKKNNNIEELRELSYKCCQYNISISNITHDFLKLVDYGDYYLNIRYPKIPKKKYESFKKELKTDVLNIGTHIDYLLSQTNKCKEPIYIEQLICKLLL